MICIVKIILWRRSSTRQRRLLDRLVSLVHDNWSLRAVLWGNKTLETLSNSLRMRNVARLLRILHRLRLVWNKLMNLHPHQLKECLGSVILCKRAWIWDHRQAYQLKNLISQLKIRLLRSGLILHARTLAEAMAPQVNKTRDVVTIPQATSSWLSARITPHLVNTGQHTRRVQGQ